jgi:hypothetical protein
MRATLAIVLLLAVAAKADDLHLKNGRVLSGQVREEDGHYTVVDRDLKHSIPKAKVKRVVTKRTFMDEYERRLATLDKKDLEAVYAFGVWLQSSDWDSRAEVVFREVLRVDPEHRGARRALGYRLFEGEWVSPDELNRRKGLVRYEGSWYTPHDLRALKREIEANERLRVALEERRKTVKQLNRILAKFATFDKRQRRAAYDELLRYAERADSPQLRKFADDTRQYYDHLARALCRQMMTRSEINLTETELLRPVSQFTTTLGGAVRDIPLFTGIRSLNIVPQRTPVTLQLPQLDTYATHSTAEVPSGCK